MVFALPSLAEDSVPEPTQRADAPYRLFRSKNIYTFLKLDTRTGQVWQLQWSTEPKERFIRPINSTPLADGKESSRFTLYPTQNVYTGWQTVADPVGRASRTSYYAHYGPTP